MSYTAGPWTAQPVTGSASFAHRVYADRREIAMVWHHPGQRPKAATGEQEQADAALIAAAPELLCAMKELFKQCLMVHKHWGDGNNQKEADAAIKAGLAAMAKATEGEVTP